MAETPKKQADKPAKTQIWKPDRGGKAPAGLERGVFAKPVVDYVTKVLDPVIARKAGMDMDLLTAWEEIVGETHAAYTLPEKLAWPRKAHEDDPFKPATLIVACDGARAVFFQHESNEIIQRVNAFLGFGAVDRLKIVQKPIKRKTIKKTRKTEPLSPEIVQKLEKSLQSVEDEALRASLKKLGEGVFREGSSSKK